MSSDLDADERNGTIGPTSSGKAAMTTTEPRTGNSPYGGPAGGSRYLIAAVAIAAAIVLILAGALIWVNSNGSAPSTPPGASATSTPGPASSVTATPATPEQLAGAAAADAYRRYILVLDNTTHSGGRDAAALKEVASGPELAIQQNNAAVFAAKQWHSVGRLKIQSLSVESFSPAAAGSKDAPEVVLKTCLDASEAYAVDSKGKSIRPSDAPTHTRWNIVARNYPERGGFNGWFINSAVSEDVTTC